jgi:1-acyl-sn-glycerol-3-phosphate acyltransferase
MMALVKGLKFGITIIRTLFTYLLIAFLLLFTLVPLLLLIMCLPQRMCQENRLIFWLLDLLYKGVIGATLLPVCVVGRENIPDSPALFVANHQSSLDILFLGSLLDGYAHFWYALSYYANMPVLGEFIRCIGMPIDRSAPTSAGRALLRGIELIANKKRHVIIFPEGGRFNDGKVHDFLRGFAIIARKTRRPVVPVFMPYNGTVYPPRSFLIYRHPLKAVIGKPFRINEGETDETFIARVHEWFAQQVALLKK